jgi:hypothetical protein
MAPSKGLALASSTRKEIVTAGAVAIKRGRGSRTESQVICCVSHRKYRVSLSDVSLHTRISMLLSTRLRPDLPSDDNRRMLCGISKAAGRGQGEQYTNHDSLCASSLAGRSATPGLTCAEWWAMRSHVRVMSGHLCSCSCRCLHNQAHL